MSDSLKQKGYLTIEDLELGGRLPAAARMAAGPVAVIECMQDIPCNPCEEACRFGAVTVGQPITSLPVLHEDKCKGCGACIPCCPGLAIFVVDCSQSGPMGTVQMPYEYRPLPKPGDAAMGLNRQGKAVVDVVVSKVQMLPQYDCTALVTVTVPKEHVNQVRSIRLTGGE